jgi:hypothetical protein
MKCHLRVFWMLALFPFALTGSAALAQTEVKWDASQLQIEAVAGTSIATSASFSLNNDIEKVSFTITRELAGLVTVVPPTTDVFVSGAYSVELIISVPRNTPEAIIYGTLHLRSGQRTISKPLPITLIIKHANSTVIPTTIAQPSLDRIFEDTDAGIEFVLDEALIAFKEETSTEDRIAIISRYAGTFLGSDSELDFYQVSFPSVSDPNDLDQIIAQLNDEPIVDFATRSWILSARRIPDLGNDPQWFTSLDDKEWNEQNPNGRNSALEYVQLPSAWDITVGSKEVKIAVIDTNFDVKHKDLTGNLLVKRFQSLAGDEHGTAVAGIIGATGNNAVGITGVMWQVSLNAYGIGIAFTEKSMLFGNAITYASKAIDDGARVINYSGGVESNSGIIASQNYAWRKLLLDKKKSKNVLFVFASGNTKGRNDQLSSPSSLATDYDNVVSVTCIGFDASKPTNELDCNGGNVSVAAPGSLYTTKPGNQYDWFEGTSAATPLVSGLAGLIWSKYPDLEPKKVKLAIVEGAKNGKKQVPDQSFYVVNAYESLKSLQLPPVAGFTLTSGSQSATEGQTLSLTIPTGTTTANVSFSANRSSDVDGTVTAWEWKINNTLVSTASSFAYALGVGVSSVTLTVTDNQGYQSQPANGTIVIAKEPPPSGGVTIFSNYGPNDSVCSTCNFWDTGVHSPEQPYHRAMPFTVPSGNSFTLDSITVSAFESGLGSEPAIYIVSVNSDSGGAPGPALEQFVFSNLSGTDYAHPALLMGVSLLHPTLSAGAQYWITTDVTSPGTMAVGWPMNNQGSTGFVAWHAGNNPWTIPFGNVPQTLGAFNVMGTPMFAAKTITFNFTGLVTNVGQYFMSTIPFGTTLSGSLSYELSAEDRNPNSGLGVYLTKLPFTITFNTPTGPLQISAKKPTYIGIADNWGDTTDVLQIQATGLISAGGLPVSAISTVALSVESIVNPLDFLTSDALPAALDFTKVQYSQGRIDGDPWTQGTRCDFQITSMTLAETEEVIVKSDDLIRIDGDASDWVNESSLVIEDAIGDVVNPPPYTDIKNVSIANDANNLYIKFEIVEESVDPNLYIEILLDVDGDSATGSRDGKRVNGEFTDVNMGIDAFARVIPYSANLSSNSLLYVPTLTAPVTSLLFYKGIGGVVEVAIPISELTRFVPQNNAMRWYVTTTRSSFAWGDDVGLVGFTEPTIYIWR